MIFIEMKILLNIHERWWTIIFTWNELNYQVDLFSSFSILFQLQSGIRTLILFDNSQI